MARILCIETATTNCSVGVAVDGKLVACREDNPQGLAGKSYSHAETLTKFIEDTLKTAQINFNELDAVAIGMGPGSYTGLRIGVSSAKGLCMALEIPLIAINSLEILTQSATHKADFYVPMLDARRMEAYTAVFNANKEIVKPTWAEVLTEASFNTYLNTNKTVLFLGSAVAKYKPLCTYMQAKFQQDVLPSATGMATLATIKYQKGDFEDVAYFEPYY